MLEIRSRSDYNNSYKRHAPQSNGSSQLYDYQKGNLTLVGAVAFLMSFITLGLPDIDHRDDDADNRHYNTDNFKNHSKHQ